jgi:toxin FitB
MGTTYLIDTNTVSKYIRGLYDATTLLFLDNVFNSNQAYISFVTKIELLAYNPQVNTAEIALYRKNIDAFLEKVPMLLIDEAIVTKTIHIRKNTRVKLPDCLIGASAIAHNHVLISSNASDFDKMKGWGLSYINPESL